MKRKTLSILFFVLFSSLVYPQGNNSEMDKIILEQADDMAKNFLAKDYAAFLKYSHPIVIKNMGGEEKMIADTKKAFEDIEAEGITFLSVKFSEPSKIVTVKDELQCTLSEIIEMKVPGKKVTTTTTLIAISPNKGKNWYFVDTAGHNLANLTTLIPTLSSELVVPRPSDPQIEEDQKPED